MKTISKALLAVLALSSAVAVAACQPFRATHHAVVPATLGVARTSVDLAAVADLPGPITLETVVGADWEIDRSGLINLDHPRAKAAGLTDGPEPIIVPFHAVKHPTQGIYLVDTGVERALRERSDEAAVHGLMARAIHVEKMRFRTDTASWITAQREPVAGVFLTHLHADHIMGMRDVPAGAPVFMGPGEAAESSFQNLFVGPVTDAALAGKGPIREWRFTPDAGGDFEGVIDVFGDGSFWALWVPGHTPGSTAYLARTPDGPVLMVGDACHTAWGWEHGVEPGTFSHDRAKSVGSLARLRRFAEKHPRIDVRLGHQMMREKAQPR